ncbi:hypothetical protein F383_32471 [Gossypium arboreum]|uniref:Uncharacterized protein n=1 Tax=Gossypium arboreum TaxID=29729 RepID=A0A0B0N0A3_GOSAR|nr:hypothetical protein F383_32471 [Gossypium arboreum]
MLHTALHMSV